MSVIDVIPTAKSCAMTEGYTALSLEFEQAPSSGNAAHKITPAMCFTRLGIKPPSAAPVLRMCRVGFWSASVSALVKKWLIDGLLRHVVPGRQHYCSCCEKPPLLSLFPWNVKPLAWIQ
jgi:hypothetical protein